MGKAGERRSCQKARITKTPTLARAAGCQAAHNDTCASAFVAAVSLTAASQLALRMLALLEWQQRSGQGQEGETARVPYGCGGAIMVAAAMEAASVRAAS